jgi:hypothetical protein
MLRPPQRAHEQELLEFWRQYGDVVSKQYVLNFDTGPSGSYGYETVHHDPRARCTLPFKILDVNWSGNVPFLHLVATANRHPGWAAHRKY